VTQFDWLEFPAPKLDVTPRYQVADALAGVFRAFEPQLVYVPHPGDLHADHGAVYYAALVAARPVGRYSVRRILSYETLSETEWAPPKPEAAFIPTVFVNVSETLERKLEAMACYASQLRAFPHSRSLEALRALAQLRGSTVGVAAAESFMLVREVID
jgi:LmbE family N-acetylglucosaminyl deacetylase